MTFVAVAAPGPRATSFSGRDPASGLFTGAFAGSSSFNRLESDADISPEPALQRAWCGIMSHGTAADGC
jgi:hypothetical protein